MTNKMNPLDPSDQSAMALEGPITAIKTTTAYNEPGLPTPPAGWGKVIGFTDSVDGDDEGPEARDES